MKLVTLKRRFIVWYHKPSRPFEKLIRSLERSKRLSEIRQKNSIYDLSDMD